MNVAVIHLEVKPDKVNELKAIWEPITAEAKKTKGLFNAILLTHAHSGRSLAIGFWDSFENAKAFEANPIYQDFISKLKPLLTGSPRREVYEVAGDVSNLAAQKKAA